jgi:hypothetical protein
MIYRALGRASGLFLVGALLCPAVLLANPLPPAAVFTHVQPIDPQFCGQTAITLCDQLVQYTEESGPLEFDLFIDPLAFWGEALYALTLDLEWPAGWVLLGWEPCGGGGGSFDVAGDRGTLALTWPACPIMSGELFLAARVSFDVTATGRLRVLDCGGQTIGVGCPPGTFYEWALTNGAMAAVECAYCWADCEYGDGPCRVEPTPKRLDLEAAQGEVLTRDVEVHYWGPCPCDYVVTEPWIEYELEWVGEYDQLMHVTIDTGPLVPGAYSAWIRLESECVDCVRVELTVLPHGQEVEEYDPAGVPTSWGRIKSGYR